LKNRINISIAAIFLTTLFIGCKKETVLSGIPSITILSVNPVNVVDFKDSITIFVKYEDADGDLGMSDPDLNVLYIKDSRLSEADYYFVKPLAPPNTNINIQGQINVVIKNTFLLGSAKTETTTYELKIKDKKGNWSNSAVTPVITINK
jgi:hypothetical protein